MDKLSFRQRRAMGLTFRNVRSTLKTLDCENKSHAELSVEVMGVLMGQSPSAWKDPAIDWENINWDAIFAFIERLISLIMLFFV